MVTSPTNMDVISRALRLNAVINWELLNSARRFIMHCSQVRQVFAR